MGKFGKKVTVSKNMNDFMIGMLAPSGFGKTTLMYKTCEKLFGDDGYIIGDMGNENGVAALDGVVAERIPTWKKFKEVVDDIVKNKETDYPSLKVFVMDTLDAAFEIAEEYTVKMWNSENMGQQGFKPASSVNSVEGGFGKGLERVIDTVKKEIMRLNKAGVGVWWTAHVKEKDQTDLFTGSAYTMLTANMSTKYFNSIKNISHIVGFGYFDRSIEQQEVGKENIVTKKKKTRETVLSEARRIKFRDDALIADAKSRFAEIEPEINLDVNEFIDAITNAINASCKGSKVNTSTSKKKSATPDPEDETEDELLKQLNEVVNNAVEDEAEEAVEEDVTAVEETVEDDDEVPFDIDEEEQEPEIDLEALCADIRKAFKTADATTKADVKAILSANGKAKLDVSLGADVLMEIKNMLA